jgi:fibronectin-binding autotransporter adhesin
LTPIAVKRGRQRLEKLADRGSTLTRDLLSSTNADQIVAPSVTIKSLGTALLLNIVANDKYTILKITGGASATNTFNGLPEGQVFLIGSVQFKITYVGGTGHDVVLTALTGGSGVSLVSTTVNGGGGGG